MIAKAVVQELSSYSPNENTTVALDTNILLAITYPGLQATPKWRAELSDYCTYVEACERASAPLVTTMLNVAELARVVEQLELEIFNAQEGSSWSLKRFRHDPAQRKNVCEELSVVLGQVFTRFSVLPCPPLPAACIQDLAWLATAVDCMDHLIIELLRESLQGMEVTIMTDDADFAYVDGIVVLTANDRAINVARSAGTLRTIGVDAFFEAIKKPKGGR